MKFLLFLVSCFMVSLNIKLASNQNNCGGNCIPSEDGKGCAQCPCGQTPNYINIKSKCGKYFWSQYCCNCIILSLSQGNQKASFVEERILFESNIFAGLFLFEIQSRFQDWCDADKSFQKAYGLYAQAGYKWTRVARSEIINQCGCWVPG